MALRTRCRSFWGLLMAAGLLTGCVDVNLGKGTLQPTRLYLLSAMDAAARSPASKAEARAAIGVGPAAIAAYLERPQILVRTGPRELQALPFALWAEPLKENILRVLAVNLAVLTGAQAVYRYPWQQDQAPQICLRLSIERFDADPKGEAVLTLNWEWSDQQGIPLMPRERSIFRQAVAGDGEDALLAAMAATLEAFSREIALRLETIWPQD